MTIAIKITNNDSRDTAIVKVSGVHKQPNSMIPILANSYELKGGESKDVYLHRGESIIVEEARNG